VKRDKNVSIEEFKAVFTNLIPTTLKQTEWMCSTVERLTRENPELREKIGEWCKMPEPDERELKEFFTYILVKAGKDEEYEKQNVG